MISLKFEDCVLHYGRQYYDFAEGSLIFTAPGQAFEAKNQPSTVSEDSWALYFHPDLLRKSDLGTKIKSYGFFSYSFNEALHLSEREKAKITRCIEAIEDECQQHIDQHSQTVIVANLELLLHYCNRFYDRQFYTRSPHLGDVVEKVETLLLDYFSSDKGLRHGIPTVKFCAEQVNLSPNYLSDLLKKETGKNTQEHIHYHLIERAKNALLASDEPVSAIAYDLGFEHPQSFGALFKKKVGMPPSRFRQLN
jgi:AraC-like DNA-binding protein